LQVLFYSKIRMGKRIKYLQTHRADVLHNICKKSVEVLYS
jgi:hypothetical protein